MDYLKFYKGFIPTKNKGAITPYKNKDLFRYDEIKNMTEFAGVLAEDTVLIDIDDKDYTVRGRKLSEVMLDIIEDLQLNCRVHESRGGIHILFKNDNRIKKCFTAQTLACGIPSDAKVGLKASYEVLKVDGEERFVIWDKEPGADYDIVPKWMTYISNNDFINMSEGDGRNQKLFNYILTLQSNGFSKSEARECIRIINKYVLATPLKESELNTILREEAFEKPVFYEGKTFLFDKFASFLVSEKHICKINQQLHIYKDGVYVDGYIPIQQSMIELIPNLKDTQRKEVLKYLELIAPDKKMSSANYIAFKNGIYDLVTDTLLPYTDDIVITNMIPHNYNHDAYSELADKTLNKMACNDSQIRDMLECYIGYNFHRLNELRTSFFFVGGKRNGKSTFLDIMIEILGQDNVSALEVKEIGDRFNSAMLQGKLANIGDDISTEFLTDNSVALFKKVVTGQLIKAERKGLDPYQYRPYAKLSFSVNEMPKMRDKTGAVMDRIVMIPFDATFSKDDEDYRPFIKYELMEESCLEYFIKIGIEGLKRVLENNAFPVSDKCIEKLEEYKIENDNFLQFTQDLTVDDIVNKTSQEVYLRYTASLTGRQQEINKFTFSKRVCEHFNLHTEQRRVNGKVVSVYVNNI